MPYQRQVFSTRGSVPTAGTATSATSSTNVTSLTANKPTVVDNTLLIAQLSWNGSASTLTVPSGWTALTGFTTVATGTYVSIVYWKYIAVAANEAATTYQWSWVTGRACSLIIAPISGVSAWQWFDSSSSGNPSPSTFNNQTNSTAPSTPLLPPTNVLLVGGAVVNVDNTQSITVPTQMTEILQVAGARSSLAYEARATGGQVGGANTVYSRTWTTTGTISAWMIAVRPIDSYTWTKPNWAKTVSFVLHNGGGGGGSGRKGATLGGRGGGGGGAGGQRLEVTFPAEALPASATIVVGGGGSGGAAQATDSNTGRTGGSGGLSIVSLGGSFSNISINSQPTGGQNGTNTSVSGGSTPNDGWTLENYNNAGGGIGGTAGNAATSGLLAAGGGGGGSGVTGANSATGTGGAGAGVLPFIGAPSANSGSEGAAGADGTASPTGLHGGSGGSGGKGSTVGAGGNGGAGGAPGGGGGGGGAGTDTVGNSGAGGDGANGSVVVIGAG